jgi:hypothetical protein
MDEDDIKRKNQEELDKKKRPQENAGAVPRKTSDSEGEEKTADKKKEDKKVNPDEQKNKKPLKSSEATFEGNATGIDNLNSSIKNAYAMYEKSPMRQGLAAAATAPVWGPIAITCMAAGALVSGAKATPGALASGAKAVANAPGALVKAIKGIGNHPADDAKIEKSQELSDLGKGHDAAAAHKDTGTPGVEEVHLGKPGGG